MQKEIARAPFFRKPWFIAAVGAGVALVGCVAFAPLLLRGYARGVIEREVGAKVNGAVTVGAVKLGWFSPQRLEALAIQGDGDIGSVTVTAEVAQGLLALVTGNEVTLSVSGRAQTPIDAEGRAGLARLPRASEAVRGGSAEGGAPAAPPVAGGVAQPVLGGRKIRIELVGIDLDATRDGKPLYAIDDLSGWVALEGAPAPDAGLEGLKVNGELKAATAIAQGAALRAGDFDATFDAVIPRGADGAFRALAAAGSAKVNASNLPVPSPIGQEIVAESLRADAEFEPNRTSVDLDASLRAGVDPPATLDAAIEAGALFDAGGAFALDPATVTAEVEVKSLPMSVLQPYAPEIREGVRLNFVEDFGRSADLRLVKGKGGRANFLLETQRVKAAFDGAVAADGGAIEDGSLEASVSVRPELLRALGVDAVGPLVARADGTRIAWRRAGGTIGNVAGDGSSARQGGALDSIGGAFALELAERFGVRGLFEAGGEKVDVRADALRATLLKPLGAGPARMTASVEGVHAGERRVQASLSGDLDLGLKAFTGGALDATLVLDPAMVERVSKGAVVVARPDTSVKLVVPAFAYRPGEGRGALQALDARGRIEVAGDLRVAGGQSTALVRGLGADIALPSAQAPGSLDLAARIDGAETRIVQRFNAIPQTFDDPAALGLEGSIDVRGLDPSVITRFAPAAKQSLGVLGTGPMTVSARNRTEGGALAADFTLTAATLSASGSARYARDALSAGNLACDLALTPELLAAIKMPDAIAIAPGARATVRVPALALAKGADGWAPSGDLSARIAVDRLRVERAPGLKAALEVPRLEADATYDLKDERAVAKGFATLGTGGSAGRLGYDLVWKKPAEAKLFRGVEGTLALSQIDLARLEGPLGLEPGGYSGMLGGAGDCTVELRERGAAQAKVAIAFPKTRGSVSVDLVEEAGRRLARGGGEIDAQIAPDAFAALAGIGGGAGAKGPARRVTGPVAAKLAIRSAAVPLDADLKPLLADAALEVVGSLSPVGIEVTDAEGRKSTVSTGALSLSAKAARLSDELVIRVAGDGGAAGAPPAAQGSLDLDARVRGAIARTKDAKATPVVDATLKATKFPAATVDALAGTKGAVGRYVGDAIDAEVVARGVSTAAGSRGSLAARISSQFASIDAPALTVGDGFIRSGPEKPMRATFTLSPEVREQLLTPINPVFSDVTSKEPARFALTSLAWPLDGDRRKFDAAFTLETGEIQLTNAGPIAFLLSVLQAGRTEGFEAQIDPLRVTVSKGRLTYRDFSLRAGKTQQGAWRNSLVFAGDIDLAATPMYANEIRTAVPLSDAANWSSDARRVFEAIGAASPELLGSLSVGVKLSGPIFDSRGKPAKLKQEIALPDVGDLLRDNPEAVIKGIGGILDALRKKDKKK